MTKEELEKEAEEYADTKVKDRKGYNARWELVRNAYLAGAEPREKRITELEKENAELKSELHRVSLNEQLATNNGRNFLKQIAELEAQIEKMKQDLDSARENANRQEQWEIYSVLNGIYNDNFEVITSVSN